METSLVDGFRCALETSPQLAAEVLWSHVAAATHQEFLACLAMFHVAAFNAGSDRSSQQLNDCAELIKKLLCRL
jgi:hypothetical protein